MKRRILNLGLVFILPLSMSAQDIHFSQYYASPLTLNPAHTGLVNRDFRVAAIYRTQNYTVSDNPYVTGALSFDMPILTGKLPEGDAVGVGGVFFYDKAGTGALQNMTAGLSLAYHKSLGIDKQHTVSLGFQAFYVSKSINFDKLKFPEQLDPRMPEAYIPATELFNNTDVTYPDFNLGLLYTGRVNENATVYGGVSYYHLTKPEERFLSGGGGVDSSGNAFSVKINPRISGYLGGAAQLNNYTTLFASALFQKQGEAQEMLLGAATGFILNPAHKEEVGNTILYLGAWYRVNDAIIPYVGFEWTTFQLGFTYDVTVSNLQNATKSQGAYEVSLIYNGLFKFEKQRKYNFACPKF